MEYFTLEKDKNVIKRKNKKTQKLIIFTFIIFSLIALRGLDLITLEFHKKYLNGNHENVREVLNLYSNGTKIEKSTLDNSTNSTQELFTRTFGLYFFTESKEKPDYTDSNNSYLEHLIKNKMLNEIDLDIQSLDGFIRIDKFSNSGFYWFPFIKQGQNVYVISLGSQKAYLKNDKLRDNYNAKFTGSINFEVYGICSIDQLNKEISEEIADEVVKFVKADLESYK